MIHTARPAPPQTSETVVQAQLSVKFWGVRGSVPTPVAANQRYGGNTACVEVSLGGQHIIFDGGTGLVELGHQLHNQNAPIDAHLFFTHTQWDRIQGFPFFQPAFTKGNRFAIYGGTAPNGASIKHCLTDQMLKPHFSMPLQNMRAKLAFHPLAAQSSFQIGDVLVETMQINAATQALGYRLTCEDYTVVYATDTPINCVDLDFLQFVDQADMLLYDGTYSDLGYLREAHHETLNPWEVGLDIVKKANIKELVLIHHSPVQSDECLDQLQHDMRDRFANTQIAYEGMEINR